MIPCWAERVVTEGVSNVFRVPSAGCSVLIGCNLATRVCIKAEPLRAIGGPVSREVTRSTSSTSPAVETSVS